MRTAGGTRNPPACSFGICPPQTSIRGLIEMQYNRNDMDLDRCCFRVRGDVLEICPAQGGEYLIRVEFFGDEIDRITEADPLTGQVHAVQRGSRRRRASGLYDSQILQSIKDGYLMRTAGRRRSMRRAR